MTFFYKHTFGEPQLLAETNDVSADGGDMLDASETMGGDGGDDLLG